MTDNGLYDMRLKLMELQNQLLKDASQKPNQVADTSEAPVKANAVESKAEDMMSVLREIRQNQRKMLELLMEINHKIK